ncbi:MAG: hypothetical protein IT249_05090 [Chitinophagaceae bacterium]|nr:hypothetical protein [Chitinophagaceae bacterium]
MDKKSLGSAKAIWKIIQYAFWGVGLMLLFFLIFLPDIGVILFWNILIPVAPALLVIATGVWRNICPLATTALAPDHFGLSSNKKLSFSQQKTLNLIGVVILFLIIPLRHIIYNTNGRATALLIMSVALIAVIYGII